jgi:tetratricopeptide (TPR) repeat protein
VLRVPSTLQPASHTEYLTYGFDDRKPDSAIAYLQWENKRIPFKIEVPNSNDLYIAQMRKDLLGWAGFNYQNYQTAAQFCADSKINLDEALVWADKAINVPFRGATKGSADFSTFQTKAAVLTALGRPEEADALMVKAFDLPGSDLLSVHFYGMSVLSAGRPEKALEIFKLNQQKHPEEKFWTYMALARAYTALNDKPNAIKNWEVALANVPANRKHQIPTYQRALQQLKTAP